jgi:hypothetical protein
MRRILIYLSFTMLLISCDYPIFVHYTVQNNTKDTVVLRGTFLTDEFTKTSHDTTLRLLPGASDTLFTFRSIGPRVYIPENSDTLKYLRNVDVRRSLTELSQKIIITKNWKFIITKRNVARLEFQIN